MIRNLTPSFILEEVSQDNVSGRFDAVVLFIDTSGFTALTVRLTEHGLDGAELLANILLAVFEPLVTAVYAHGGFVAGFAGDAFKAFFPGQTSASYLQALATAEAILNHIAKHPSHATELGTFDFSVRCSIADGMVTWAIWSTGDHTVAQTAGYTFAGAAIDQAIQGEDHAEGGELVVTTAVHAALCMAQPGCIDGEELTGAANGYVRINHISGILPQPQNIANQEPVALVSASRFYPTTLLTMQPQGEFRPVYSIFVNVQQLPEPGTAGDFLPIFLQLLDQYGGYLCRIGRVGADDPGGTFLLFWGAPTSHENDLQRALKFLSALQTEINVPLRAGMTHGIVYAGFIGSTLREEYTCYGNSVNQAARQMAVAKWGEILLDGETSQRAQDDFDVTLAGHHWFKGFATEQPVFQLHSARQTETEPLFRGRFIGRQRELAQLENALQPIHAGHFGGIVVISGEAGIGKSRLVHELRTSSPAWQAVQYLFCQTDEVLRESLNPFRYVLRRYFHQHPTNSEAVNKERFTQKLGELIAVQDDATVGAELDRTRSFLGALVDLHWEDSRYAQLEPRLRFENILQALKVFFKAESQRQPLLIHLEDVHWLDVDSRTFLTHLTRNVADFPFALVATTRPVQPEVDEQDTLVPPDASQLFMDLTTLETSEVADLAHQLLGQPAATDLLTLLTERAEGNPFFIEQLLLYLEEQNYLVRTSQGYQLAAATSSSQGLPTDLQNVLIARLDRLAQAVKEVVQTAAVLGREFNVQILSQILRNDLALHNKVEDARNAEIWSALSDLRYLFRHALLRDAAYEMQLHSRLRALHQTAGMAIERLYSDNLAPHYADLAYHFDQANNNERAIHYLQLASKQASEQYRNAEVLEISERLLARLTDPIAIADARIIQCDTLLFLGRLQEALELLQTTEAIVQTLPDQHTLMRIKASQGAVLSRFGRKDEAIQALAVAESLAAEIQDEAEQAYIYQLSSNVYSRFHVDQQQAILYGQKALTLLETLGLERQITRVLLNLGNAHRHLGKLETARSYYERGVAVSNAMGDDELLARCYGSISVLHALQEDFVNAIAWMEKAVPIAQSLGATLTLNDILYNLGKMYVESGQHRRALPLLEQALTMGREMGDAKRCAKALSGIAQVHEITGNLPEAQQLQEESLRIREEIDDLQEVGLALHNLARVLARRGQFMAAIAPAERALPLLQETGNIGWNGRHNAWLGLIYAEVGRLPQALEQIVMLLDTIATTGQQFVQGMETFVIALVLMHPDHNAQVNATAPLLQLLAECTNVPSEVVANLKAAINAADAAHKYEISIRAHCTAARYWDSQGDRERVHHHLATGKAIAQRQDLPTAADEVQTICARLGVDYAVLTLARG